MTDTGIKIQHAGETLFLRETTFSENRNLCLVLMDEVGEMYAKVAVNVRKMNDNEFVLNHDVEESLEMKLVETGKFQKVGTAKYGYCEQPIYKFIRG